MLGSIHGHGRANILAKLERAQDTHLLVFQAWLQTVNTCSHHPKQGFSAHLWLLLLLTSWNTPRWHPSIQATVSHVPRSSPSSPSAHALSALPWCIWAFAILLPLLVFQDPNCPASLLDLRPKANSKLRVTSYPSAKAHSSSRKASVADTLRSSPATPSPPLPCIKGTLSLLF